MQFFKVLHKTCVKSVGYSSQELDYKKIPDVSWLPCQRRELWTVRLHPYMAKIKSKNITFDSEPYLFQSQLHFWFNKGLIKIQILLPSHAYM